MSTVPHSQRISRDGCAKGGRSRCTLQPPRMRHGSSSLRALAPKYGQQPAWYSPHHQANMLKPMCFMRRAFLDFAMSL
eukprot:1117950-Amphidinium_carterae.1